MAFRPALVGPRGDSMAGMWGHGAVGLKHQRLSPAQGGHAPPTSSANFTLGGSGNAVYILDALLGFIPIFTFPLTRLCPNPQPCRLLELG